MKSSDFDEFLVCALVGFFAGLSVYLIVVH